ncbi:MAG: hypothetical protein R3F61_20905 [Myxococcota bacterium]
MTLANAVLAGVGRAVVPLDAARRALYRPLVPWLGPWIRSREVRAVLNGLVGVLGSLVLAVVAPIWLLALGPVLLGVPHLVADVRYLVARPGLHRRTGAWLVGGGLALSSALVDIRYGLVAAALVPLCARGVWPLRWLAALPFAALAASGWMAHHATGLALAHVHNLIAVGLWLLLSVALHPSPSGLVFRGLPTLAFALGGLAILSGALDPWLGARWVPALPGAPDLDLHARVLAPGAEPTWALRWVVAFAYAQSVHYALWLRVIPEEGRDRPSTRSWGASLAALRADLGAPLLAGALVLTGAIALWGLADLAAARDGYLRLALFHGPLELSVLALVAVEGRQVLRP